MNKLHKIVLPFALILSAAAFLCFSCRSSEQDKADLQSTDFRSEMRSFISAIAQKARAQNPSFIVIPQNGQELITLNDESDGPLAQEYVSRINGIGREDVYFGYEKDNVPTPKKVNEYLKNWLDVYKQNGKSVLVIDYCKGKENTDFSYRKNKENGYISFVADQRELNAVPKYPHPPFNVNTNDIKELAQARNFLYLINPERYKTKEEFIDDMAKTDYDLIVVDLFFNETELSAQDVKRLQRKNNGARRLIICYMSIGEAEDYRYYWRQEWKQQKPSWLKKENPDWQGNYIVAYWENEWQNIIFDYTDKITSRGFDGVYLDIVDAFTYFESK